MAGFARFVEAVDLVKTGKFVTLNSKKLAAGTFQTTQSGWDAEIGMSGVDLFETETVVEK